jgi:DNA polymerase-3 subunit epsilon
MTVESIEELVKTLAEHDDYRVLKRFKRVDYYHKDDLQAGPVDKLQGVFIDTETTGLNYLQDKIIEIGIVPFEFDQMGRIYAVGEGYNALHDPGVLLDEKITSLTGITNEMLKGQVIDSAIVEAMIKPASIVIAHNAGFDRKFVEKQFPVFIEKSWGCSYLQVPWALENIPMAKLEYLAYKYGFFYEAHRASMDCLVAIEILSQRLPVSGELVLKTLLANTKQKVYRIWAESSPFSAKDILKNRGYRWNDGINNKPRAWYVEVEEANKEAELNQEIYKNSLGNNLIRIDEITSFNRFSSR